MTPPVAGIVPYLGGRTSVVGGRSARGSDVGRRGSGSVVGVGCDNRPPTTDSREKGLLRSPASTAAAAALAAASGGIASGAAAARGRLRKGLLGTEDLRHRGVGAHLVHVAAADAHRADQLVL